MKAMQTRRLPASPDHLPYRLRWRRRASPSSLPLRANRLGTHRRFGQASHSLVGRERIVFAFTIAAYYALLFLDYVYFISPAYSYAGLTSNVSIPKLYSSAAIVLLIAMFHPLDATRLRAVLSLIAYLAGFVPLAVFFAANDSSGIFFYNAAAAFVIFLVIANADFAAIPKVSVPRLFVEGALWGLVAFIFLAILAAGGLSIFSLNPFSVYDRRPVASVMFSGLGLPYLLPWTANVALPALAGIGLYRRQRYVAAAAVILAILLYGFTTHKGMALGTVLVVGLYFVRKTLNNLVVGVAAAAACVVALALVEEAAFGSSYLNSFIVRRVFFVPAMLAFSYYNLFSEIGNVYMSSSNIPIFGAYPFSDPPPTLVSLFVFGHPYSNANNGIFGTGYMHFGFAGIYIWLGLAGVYVNLAQSMSRAVPAWFTLSLTAVPVFALFTNADLPTGLLTHGFALALVVLYGVAGSAASHGSRLPGDVTGHSAMRRWHGPR